MAGYDSSGIVLPIHLPLLATHPRAHAKVPVSLVAICANGGVKSGGHDGRIIQYEAQLRGMKCTHTGPAKQAAAYPTLPILSVERFAAVTAVWRDCCALGATGRPERVVCGFHVGLNLEPSVPGRVEG